MATSVSAVYVIQLVPMISNIIVIAIAIVNVDIFDMRLQTNQLVDQLLLLGSIFLLFYA